LAGTSRSYVYWICLKRRPMRPAIGTAQRVEHYEFAAYTTARNVALQLIVAARRVCW
jgi:hypothetical protein